MIEIAELSEKENPLGVRYCLREGKDNYLFDQKFDLVTAAYFFHYASSVDELREFFAGAANNLKSGGRLVAINNNPDNPVGGKIVGAESFGEWLDKPFVDGSRILISIFDKDGGKICDFRNYYWSRETYSRIMNEVGLVNVRWSLTKMDEEGKALSPNWEDIERDPIILVLEADKA